jgi:hypothetical protein
VERAKAELDPTKGSTFYNWGEKIREGSFCARPKFGGKRRKGGGRDFALTWENEQMVIDKLRQRQEEYGETIDYATARNCVLRFGQHSPAAWPEFQCSPKFLQEMYDRHSFDPVVAKTDQEEVTRAARATTTQMVEFLAQVFEWRAEFARRHFAGQGIVLEPNVTFPRMYNLDEVKWSFHSKKDKQDLTVMLCTSGMGAIKTVLVVFDGKRQPTYAGEPGLVNVEGVDFFVAYNDTHWNNKLLNYLILDHLTSHHQPCPDHGHQCKHELYIFDNFDGHFFEPLFELLQARGIQPIICPLTDKGQPNDNAFNGFVKTNFYKMIFHFQEKRGSHNTRVEKENKKAAPDQKQPLLPQLTAEQNRMMTLYGLRVTL